MGRTSVFMSILASLFVLTIALGGETSPTLITTTGIVDKVDKDSLTIQPRGTGGKFGKAVVLKLTGTSKLSQVSQEKRGGKMVPVQRDLDAKDLEAKQQIAVIYIQTGKDNTLLSAVVQKEPSKK